MEDNKVILNVIVNHIETREFNNQIFNVYTLTEFTSGQNFSIWSREKINYFDGAKLLLESIKVKFNVVVTNSKIKLVPIERIKGV